MTTSSPQQSDLTPPSDPHEHTRNTLDFPKILAHLAGHTAFSAGRELALALLPTSELTEARRRQQETSEARTLLSAKTNLSLGGARDVRPLVSRAQRGGVLLPHELLDVRSTLLSARTLRRTIARQGAQFPLLAGLAGRIEECPHVAAEIARCLDERGEVLDSASHKLARIRRELRQAHSQLLERLNKLVNSPDNAPYLQEPLVTQRHGRYVIPLKADFKGRIPGLIHDHSASGATLFIEPLATVELNNRWRELELEEEKEIHRILLALSDLVADEGQFIVQTVEVLAELDLAFAKAKYADEIEGVEPKLVGFKSLSEHPPAGSGTRGRGAALPHPGSTIQLKQARHPLLDPATVVPIDVHLGHDFFVLVITGPNTGGKTVSLKTVGLLSLMAQAGLHIPAAEGSALSVFDGVYADIGDEQSIEQSLSTFSSHLINIIGILAQATSRSLVLLDELGAGTDPSEGSALARALLTTLLERRVTTLATTHYSELKVYAHATPGVRNASVEFDMETLSPTFELNIGLPGRSNALAIATRLGLPPDIVERARSMVSDESLETEGLLADIKRLREEMARTQRAAEAARAEAEALRAELRRQLAEVEATRREVLSAARQEARAELEMVREEIQRIRRRLESDAIPPEWLAQAAARLAELEQEMAPLEPAPPSQPLPAGEMAVGDTVWVASVGVRGELTALSDDEAEVQAGNVRLRVRRPQLELHHRAPSAAEEHPRRAITAPPAPPSPGIELDLRGERVDEMLPRLEKYLDEACRAGLPQVRIIHGKGTGALRQAVRQRLDGHPLVSSYRPGDQTEGGNGVTVADLVTA